MNIVGILILFILWIIIVLAFIWLLIILNRYTRLKLTEEDMFNLFMLCIACFLLIWALLERVMIG